MEQFIVTKSMTVEVSILVNAENEEQAKLEAVSDIDNGFDNIDEDDMTVSVASKMVDVCVESLDDYFGE